MIIKDAVCVDHRIFKYIDSPRLIKALCQNGWEVKEERLGLAVLGMRGYFLYIPTNKSSQDYEFLMHRAISDIAEMEEATGETYV